MRVTREAESKRVVRTTKRSVLGMRREAIRLRLTPPNRAATTVHTTAVGSGTNEKDIENIGRTGYRTTVNMHLARDNAFDEPSFLGNLAYLNAHEVAPTDATAPDELMLGRRVVLCNVGKGTREAEADFNEIADSIRNNIIFKSCLYTL